MVALPYDMVKILEKERKDRYLETIPETIRVILSEYLRTKVHSKWIWWLLVIRLFNFLQFLFFLLFTLNWYFNLLNKKVLGLNKISDEYRVAYYTVDLSKFLIFDKLVSQS
jgi:hypothetical protein